MEGFWTYAYDNKNEMTEADQYNSSNVLQQKVVFKYDVFGNRVEKDVNSTSTQRFAYDGWNPSQAGGVGNANWQVWADLDGTSSLTTRYLHGDVVDQLFARIDSGTAYWEIGDRLGSVRIILDNSANVKDQITYDGWGNATQTASSFGGRYLWTGREFDVETGLQFNRARYYDPAQGRWISQDPMGFDAGDSNLYRYVNNNPTVGTDPSGFQIQVNDPITTRIYKLSAKELRAFFQILVTAQRAYSEKETAFLLRAYQVKVDNGLFMPEGEAFLSSKVVPLIQQWASDDIRVAPNKLPSGLITSKRVKMLINDLDNNTFSIRDKATKALAPIALEIVFQLAHATGSLELESRVKTIIRGQILPVYEVKVFQRVISNLDKEQQKVLTDSISTEAKRVYPQQFRDWLFPARAAPKLPY